MIHFVLLCWLSLLGYSFGNQSDDAHVCPLDGCTLPKLCDLIEDFKLLKNEVEILKRNCPVTRSCHDVWNFGRRTNGMYNIEGVGLTYCHMTDIPGCGGEGWTQVIKMDGSKNTFGFNSPLWTNKMTHKGNISQGMGNSEVKTAAYWTIPFEKVCVGMKVGNDLKWILIRHRSLSLYHVIADGKYRSTSLGRQTWKSLISGSSLQSNCNREGFNVKTITNHELRVGISSNNENDCNSNDSGIGLGVGLFGHETCGNIAKYGGDNGDKNIAAWGYIFVQ